MTIRRARQGDIPRLGELLVQVCNVHHRGRPDLFRENGRKYSDGELAALLRDESRPILVAADGEDRVLGYAFCIRQSHRGDGALQDRETLYLDDLCVDEACRGRHVGRALYEAVVALARELGCYNVTLNVWSCNGEAMAFYERCGLRPQKVGMELVLQQHP